MGHPVVGAGLETLLRLERRYDVRRVGRFSDIDQQIAGWQPDVALVDGVLLQNSERPSLGVPTLVLSGNAVDGEALRGRLDDARGWLRKDPTLEELHAAIDRTLSPSPRVRPATAFAVLAVSAVGALLLWGWLALRSAG